MNIRTKINESSYESFSKINAADLLRSMSPRQKVEIYTLDYALINKGKAGDVLEYTYPGLLDCSIKPGTIRSLNDAIQITVDMTSEEAREESDLYYD